MTGERPHDAALMRCALSLAQRGLGRTWPNPAVSCLIVDEESPLRIVARGSTAAGGRPHAETLALEAAGENARGRTAYVTLEPCAHHGRTPPCAEALIAAGVSRVVSAVMDPDPRVSGAGHAKIRSAGIALTTNVEAKAAERLNRGFFKRVQKGLPLVTLKLATSIDGQIAVQSGESQWITGERARQEAHRLRAEHDAVLIGSATAVADDPLLTCRLPGLENRTPIRIVADGRLRLPLTSSLVKTAHENPVWILTRPDSDARRKSALAGLGIDLIEVQVGADQFMDMRLALEILAARGLTRILVEGGAKLAAALLKAGLVDEIAWLRASCIIGGDGRDAVAGLGLRHLSEAVRYDRLGQTPLGDDVMEVFGPRA